MTIIVGILCQNGVVIGSDSSATFAAGQTRTIEQPIPDKTQVIGNHVLFACTGFGGLSQRFRAVLEKELNAGFLRQSGEPITIGKCVATKAIDDFRSTFVQPGGIGALLACPTAKKGFCLIEFSLIDMQPEVKTPSMWFASMGSGQPIVDPFLGLIRRSLFPDSQPNLNEGIFAVTWALQHAIELNTGGINGPMQIGVVAWDKNNSFIEAKMLTEKELAEHHQNVAEVTRHLGEYRGKLNGDGETTPDPPKAPKA